MTTIVCRSGRTRELPANLDPANVVGLDSEGRIVVDHFDAFVAQPEIRGPYADGRSYTHNPFLFGLTLCCNASDKGIDSGIACRGCYGMEEIGNYLFLREDGFGPDFDARVDLLEVRPHADMSRVTDHPFVTTSQRSL